MNIQRASPAPVECAATRCANAGAPRLELETKEQNWRMTLDFGGEGIPRTLREMLIVRSLSVR